MLPVNIRQENKDDYEAVFNVNRLAFAQENEAKLVELLRKSDAFIPELSIIAEAGNKVVGHILFTKIKIINSSGNEFTSLALAPMAVLPVLPVCFVFRQTPKERE